MGKPADGAASPGGAERPAGAAREIRTGHEDRAMKHDPPNARYREERHSRIVGMIMAFVWLAFLIPPVMGILARDAPASAKAIPLACIAAFIASYVAATSYAFTRPDPFSDTFYPVSAALAASSFLIFVGLTLAYPGSAAMGIYVIAQVVTTLPPRIGSTVGAALTVGVLLLTSDLPDDGAWALGIISVAVYVSTVATGFFTRQSERENRSARREAALDERERIARDVHDVLGHTLTVIALKSELAAKLFDRDPTRVRAELADINELSRQAIADVRSTVSGLAGRQLASELAHIKEVADDAGISLTITGTADDADPGHRILFGWVAREAMTNIVRHSGARHAAIDIAEKQIVVTDDGVGFSPLVEGNGLRGLRQRVENAGGRLRITSPGPSGRGSRIEVELS